MPDLKDLLWQPLPDDRLPEDDDLLDLELPFDDPLSDHDLVSAARLASVVQDEESET